MFSEELYELDRNTVQYMIDEMQDELDAKQIELNTVNSELNAVHTELNAVHTELNAVHTELNAAHTELNAAHTELNVAHTELNEMGIKYKQSIKNMVKVLRNIGLPDQEIMGEICSLYQFNEEQAKEYL